MYTKLLGISEDTIERVIFYIMSPPRDTDLKDREAVFPHDTPHHDDALPYHVTMMMHYHTMQP